MGFMDSYKRLEKLCGDLLNCDRPVSAYIDEMLQTPAGARSVSTWNSDLEKLKHYRWIRNQISHEPGCTEQNMCKPGDEAWLNEFYLRILNGTDPLALYSTAAVPRAVIKTPPPRPQAAPTRRPSHSYAPPHGNPVGCATWIVLSLLLIAAFVALF